MKIFKSSLLALLAITGAAMTSCSDDNNYTAGLPSDGAYFGESASKVEFSLDNTSFPVTVSRTSAQADATVSIASVDESGLFTIPTSVTFSGNELSATINIGYDPEKVEQDVNYSITLTVTPATEYGISTYSFTAVSPSPWTSLGKCTYTDDFITTFYNVQNMTYEVEIQENDLTPGLYRLVNPYGKLYPYNDPGDYDTSKDYYMTIDATDPDRVVLNRFLSGMDWGDGEFMMYSFAGYYLNAGKTPEEVDASGYFGTLENGVITWPKGTLMIGIPNGNSYSLYPANNKGAARIVMPGVVISDYSAQVDYAGRKVDVDENNLLTADVTLGEDVATARVAAVLGQDINAIAEGIIDGTIESVEITASGTVELPIEKADGIYTILVVTYDGDGEVQEYAYDFVEIAFSGKQWKEVGSAEIQDGWILPLFEVDPSKYIWYAPVEENITTPGVYRIVNMFGGDFAVAEDLLPGIHNIQINAVDKSFVYIQPQKCGLDEGFGNMTIADLPGYYVSAGYPQASIVAKLEDDELSTATVNEDGNLEITINTCLTWLPGQGGSLSPGFTGEPALITIEFADAPTTKTASVASPLSRSTMSASELQWRLGNHAIFNTARVKRAAKFLTPVATI